LNKPKWGIPPGVPPNVARLIVSQTSSYIVSSTFYVELFKNFILWGPY